LPTLQNLQESINEGDSESSFQRFDAAPVNSVYFAQDALVLTDMTSLLTPSARRELAIIPKGCAVGSAKRNNN
jgi:hypothetical protein